MRVLVTGHLGYLGSCLVPGLLTEGFEVVGTDTDLYSRCDYGAHPVNITNLGKDIRDLQPADFNGFDAVIHLAGLSNDPLGELNPALTDAINHLATLSMAQAAKAAGVARFIFSSSCSAYGAAGDEFISESASLNPVTCYGRSKVVAEQGLSALADDHFSPVFLRNATVYGYSPRMRFDLVVNNLVAWAHTSGRVLLKSQGLAWRPLVHVEDVAAAFIAALHAPQDSVHNQSLNIGQSAENYRVREIARMVVEAVPGAVLDMAAGAEADARTYRVNCDRATAVLPGWRPQWNVARGIADVYRRYLEYGLEPADFEGPRFARVAHLKMLLSQGHLDGRLRPRQAA